MNDDNLNPDDRAAWSPQFKAGREVGQREGRISALKEARENVRQLVRSHFGALMVLDKMLADERRQK